MNKIQDRFYEGERPLYGASGLMLENVKFYPGESALKEASEINANNCYFMGKYPFWHNIDTLITDSFFTIYSRAAIWYSQNITMKNCTVEAPKMFREINGLILEDVKFENAQETLWNCKNITVNNISAKEGNYIFMNCSNIEIDGLNLQGDYSFQDAKNVIIRNSYLDSKDAFWKTENVTVYDSTIIGEYLGWHSKNLKLVNCKIGGTQPLCYAENLVLENCEFMEDCDLSFEYSDVKAEIMTPIKSIKNPIKGWIKAPNIGEIIFDENSRVDDDFNIDVTEVVEN